MSVRNHIRQQLEKLAMNKKQLDYPYLRAWCRMMGSKEYYVQSQLEDARAEKAPADAIYKNNDGEWRTYATISNVATKERIKTMVEG